MFILLMLFICIYNLLITLILSFDRKFCYLSHEVDTLKERRTSLKYNWNIIVLDVFNSKKNETLIIDIELYLNVFKLVFASSAL